MSRYGANLPPGVTGNEPQITGEHRCFDCGAVLPEEAECPDCGKDMEYDSKAEEWVCPDPDCLKRLPADTCPEGCPEPDWDAERDRREGF